MKKCFGFISWFPDSDSRKERINRLNQAFRQIIDLFGEDSEFLIIAQNWKDYKIPSFIKHVKIFTYGKLGILGARKKLRKHFLESNYDYLIMCDDDIILEMKTPTAIKDFNKVLEKNPQGFWFAMYGWSLSFCAVSKWIYERVDMVDVDPEKGEGYEDMVFPFLLHYKYPEKEIKFESLKFAQYRWNYVKEHKSTWAKSGVKWNDLQIKSDYYKEQFIKGNFDIAEIKRKMVEELKARKEAELRKTENNDSALPCLDDYC